MLTAARNSARSAVTVAVTALLVLALAVLAVLTGAGRAEAGPHEPDFVAMANGSRAAVGAPPLESREDLAGIARAWSERMAREGRLYHNPAVGSQVCCWQRLAENAGYSYRGAADLHRLLMESPGHRRNLLNPAFTQVGMGTATDARGRLWVTQVFRSPDGRAVAAPAPASPIRVAWHALGASSSPLGDPVTGELATPDQVGRYTHFRSGSIYWTPTTNAQEVYGSIRQRWTALRWEAGVLGYPVTGERDTPDRRGRYNHFQSGSIYWSPATGAHEVYGSIRARWAAERWEAGPLGFPTSGEYDVPGGRANDFERGRITWDRATGLTRVEVR